MQILADLMIYNSCGIDFCFALLWVPVSSRVSVHIIKGIALAYHHALAVHIIKGIALAYHHALAVHIIKGIALAYHPLCLAAKKIDPKLDTLATNDKRPLSHKGTVLCTIPKVGGAGTYDL